MAGRVVSFRRRTSTETAVTDADGVARAVLRVTGPTGRSVPLSVNFGGAPHYDPVKIKVPFRAFARS
jgi:hypothetical protein